VLELLFGITTALFALFMGYHMGEVLAWLYERLFGTHDRPPIVKLPRFLLLHKKGAKDVSDSKDSTEGKQEDQEMADMQQESGRDLEENCDAESHFEESDETANVEQKDSREGEDEKVTGDEEGNEDNSDAAEVEQEDSREGKDGKAKKEEDEEGDEDNDATVDEDNDEATHKKGKKGKKEKKRELGKQKKEGETLCSATVVGEEGEGDEGEEWQLHHEREQVSPPFVPRSFRLLSLYCVINLVIMFAVYALLISLAVAKRDGLRLYVALMASPPATILRHFLTKRNLGRHANAFPLYTLCTCLPPEGLNPSTKVVNIIGTGLAAVLYYASYIFAPPSTPPDVDIWVDDVDVWSLLPAFQAGFCGT